MDVNVVLALFAGFVVLFSLFSTLWQRLSLPAPTLCLAFGVLLGPFALDVMRLEDFGPPPSTLLEQAARITLALSLAGIALRLPHGYWRRNIRWIAVIIGLGMAGMLLVAAGVLWAGLQVPLFAALLLAAVLTPTDPVVTTPIVTGPLAEKRIPEKIRHNLSAESGINDGLAHFFVMLAVLLFTGSATAPQELVAVLTWEILGGALFGLGTGFLMGHLFIYVKNRGLMDQSSYLVFVVPFSLLVLGGAELLNTEGLLTVFLAAAVFAQVIPERDEAEEDRIDDAVNQLLLLPAFILLGLALPIEQWIQQGWLVALIIVAAVVLRRLVTLWTLRPLLKPLHNRSETLFLSWFGPIGISTLYYALVAQKHTGHPEIFVWATLAITASVLLHGTSTGILSRWLQLHDMPSGATSRQRH
ncbi:cation:proton antiporter [Nesterenkonia sphaerica]|uniref:Sodium:proton exchanger n=1 Tax=Nesterenkonia sphaerica TaxID=1804988 RepID=A0A5R9A349_9MICC|nr:cation:proton antiporter [Nesterenkonia sphaerica]TLP73113.1 sodium:proton exchanger [Nesterenkonia sphaerica]